MSHQDKMNEIMRMCLAYVAQQNIQTTQNKSKEEIETFAERTFNEIEQFIQENSNTVVMVRYYKSYQEFISEACNGANIKQG